MARIVPVVSGNKLLNASVSDQTGPRTIQECSPPVNSIGSTASTWESSEFCFSSICIPCGSAHATWYFALVASAGID